MYQQDPLFDELLRKPMMMADQSNEPDDDYEDDEEEDLFGDDVMQALQAEKEAEQADADAFAASLLESQAEEEPEEPAEPAAAEPPPPPPKEYTLPGIWRHPLGYPLITLLGFVPLTLLSTFAVIQKSLSLPMVLFLLTFVVGLAFSVHHMIYLNKNQYTFTVNFDNVRGFFKWKEILAMSAVLVLISILNLGGLAKHHPLTLTGKHIQNEAFAPVIQEEHEEEIIYSSFKQGEAAHTQSAPEAANTQNIASTGAGGTVGLAGNQDKIGEKYNDRFKQGLPPAPSLYKGAAGGLAGLIGALTPPSEAIPPKSTFTQGTGNGLLDTLFMGGSLAAAFGYAFILAVAGLIFGAMRKFDTAFSRKYVETIHVDTAKVTRIDSPEISPAQQALNVVARMTIGACFGATLGFLLGFLQVAVLTLLFAKQATNPAISPLLSSLGLASSPDLSFANAVSLGGLMIPFVMLVVGKMSPQGFSVTDELIRQHYRIEPQGHVVSADQAGAFANPALVSFDGGLNDALEEELETNKLMKELSLDDDNLASEIIDEFGREFESVFGIDTRELLMAQGPRQSVDKKLLASALDESFGELGNVPVEISAELGQATLDLVEWLNLKEGTLVLLNKPANEEIDVLFNGVRKGKGKLIVSDSNLAVKVSSTYFNRSNGNPLHHLSV